jgi:hypothetical protein
MSAFAQRPRRALSLAMKRTKKPPRVTEHVGLRMEPELRSALEAAAAQQRRPLAHLLRNVLSDFVRDNHSQSGSRAGA